MIRVIVDTNVILDYLMRREKFYEAAEKIFNAGFKDIIKLYVPSINFSNTYYILRQTNSHQTVMEKLESLYSWTNILPVDDKVIQLAIKSAFKDFEDAVVNYAAIHDKQIKYIVTRNKKDFKASKLSVFTLMNLSVF